MAGTDWMGAAYAVVVSGALDGLTATQIADELGIEYHKAAILRALMVDGVDATNQRVRGNHRIAWARLASSGNDDTTEPSPPVPTVELDDKGLHVTATGTEPNDPHHLVTNPEDMCAVAGVDTNKWRIVRSKVNRWTTTLKGPDGEPRIVVNWQVKVDLEPRAAELLAMPKMVVVQAPPVPAPSESDIETAVHLGDPQIGFWRDSMTGKFRPMHDPDAIDVMLQVCQSIDPGNVIWPGDNVDAPELSDTFPRPPGMWDTLQASLIATRYTLGRFQSALPNTRQRWLDGNHGNPRLLRQVRKGAPVLETLRDTVTGEPVLSIRHLLKLDEMGIEYDGAYPDGVVWLFNDRLGIEHGTKVGAQSGDTVKKMLTSATVSRSQGHTHRLEVAFKRLTDGREDRIIVAGSAGCLCSVTGDTPAAKKAQNWHQGAIVYSHHKPTGLISAEPVLIDKGRALFRGRLFVAREWASEMEAATGLRVT